MLELTFAFVGYIMGGLSLIISLWVWLTLDEIKKNGIAWIQLNRELKKKIERMERDQRTPATPWKR